MHLSVMELQSLGRIVMHKRVEKYIPKALEAIVEVGINNENMIDSQYNGYIASFGASIRQAGLLATVLFYQDDNGAEKDRHKIIDAIEFIIGERLLSSEVPSNTTKKKVLDAATALKLAIRTYEKVQKEE